MVSLTKNIENVHSSSPCDFPIGKTHFIFQKKEEKVDDSFGVGMLLCSEHVIHQNPECV